VAGAAAGAAMAEWVNTRAATKSRWRMGIFLYE
jgi:hypothetical protein